MWPGLEQVSWVKRKGILCCLALYYGWNVAKIIIQHQHGKPENSYVVKDTCGQTPLLCASPLSLIRPKLCRGIKNSFANLSFVSWGSQLGHTAGNYIFHYALNPKNAKLWTRHDASANEHAPTGEISCFSRLIYCACAKLNTCGTRAKFPRIPFVLTLSILARAFTITTIIDEDSYNPFFASFSFLSWEYKKYLGVQRSCFLPHAQHVDRGDL